MEYPKYLLSMLQHLICHYQVDGTIAKWQLITLDVSDMYLVGYRLEGLSIILAAFYGYGRSGWMHALNNA